MEKERKKKKRRILLGVFITQKKLKMLFIRGEYIFFPKIVKKVEKKKKEEILYEITLLMVQLHPNYRIFH